MSNPTARRGFAVGVDAGATLCKVALPQETSLQTAVFAAGDPARVPAPGRPGPERFFPGARLTDRYRIVELLGRGMAWFDTGTHEDLLDASHFVSTIQRRQGQYIACLEEIAFNFGYISADDLRALARPLENTPYGGYLVEVADRGF